MQEITGEIIPGRWQNLWEAMDSGITADSEPGSGLQEWLEEMYFDGERRQDLTGEEITRLGSVILKLLRFEPSARAEAREILDDLA